MTTYWILLSRLHFCCSQKVFNKTNFDCSVQLGMKVCELHSIFKFIAPRKGLTKACLPGNLLIPSHRASWGSGNCTFSMLPYNLVENQAHIQSPYSLYLMLSDLGSLLLSGKFFCPVITYLPSNYGQLSLCAFIRNLNRKSTRVLPGFNNWRRWFCRISRWGLPRADLLFVKHCPINTY